MNYSSESMVKRVTYTSKKLFSLILQILILAGAIGTVLQMLALNWIWLNVIEFSLLGIFALLLTISCMTPGILIVFRVPWLAHAWFRGINTRVPNKSWENLSIIQKFLVYLWSILLFGFMLLAIIAYTVQGFGEQIIYFINNL